MTTKLTRNEQAKLGELIRCQLVREWQGLAGAKQARDREEAARHRARMGALVELANAAGCDGHGLRDLAAREAERPSWPEIPCALCGEPIEAGDEMGEFVLDQRAVLAHAPCGLERGLEIA